MYKVFLVDDEIVVREGIRNSIQWDRTPYQLAGEAADGEMALSIMKDIKPDILVTDIKMAFMDGLKLSRIMKKIFPWLKVIIISGHDEFQYAKDAISIGIEEYLLKPVTSSDLLAALDKVALMIEEDKRKLTSIENLRMQVQSSTDILRERWLHDLVSGVLKPDDAIEMARDWGVDLIAHGYLVAIIDVSFPTGDCSGLTTVRVKIKTFFENQADIICFPQSSSSFILLLKDAGKESLAETAYTLGQAIKYEIERNTDSSVAIGIGSVVERIGEISRSYTDADTVRKYLAQTGQKLIMGFSDLETLSDMDYLKLDGDPIAERLKYVQRSDIDEIIAPYMDFMETTPMKGSMIRYYLIGDIMMSASKIIEELGGELKVVIPSLSKEMKIMEIISSQQNFRDEVRKIMEAVIDYRDSKVKGKHHAMIQKAMQYIDAHYADPDISLHTVAEEVNFSPNHFSTVFSQEKGETFIEYLTAIRIEKSKELLMSTPMRSVDIAYEVGFGDPHYFSFIFKKTTGMSPREFRSGIQNKT